MQKVWNAGLWLLVAVVFACVLFADFLSLPFDTYASQRFILVYLLAGVVSFSAVVLVYRYGWALFDRIWPAVLVAGGFSLLALPFDEVPFRWAEPGLYAAFFLGFVLVGTLAVSDRNKQCFVGVLVSVAAASASLYGGATITLYLFALSDRVANLSDFIPWGFVNIRYWSHIATWFLPLLPLAVLVGPLRNQRLWRFFTALGAAIWWWVVFLSSSRGTMLGLGFGVLVAVLLIGRPTLPWLKTFLRYLAYGIILWLLLSVLVPSVLLDEVSIRSLKADASGRMPLFIEAWRMSLENFPLGMGPQSWVTHEAITEAYRRSPKFGHPHNMYLMWAAEYGWVLIGALLLLVGQAARLLWQRRREVHLGEHSDLAVPLAAFTASVAAALLHAGVSAVFMAPGSMLTGFLVLSVFWSLLATGSSSSATRFPKARAGTAIFAGLLIGLCCLCWLNEVENYHRAMETDREFYFENVPAGTMPRFWLHGNFPRHSSQMP
ncbi:O-antigen ligase [Marinobacter sp. 2_MG-2023]|uniref:O-antigen ligase family protein n=1 Tax=Marinobacter sp. 2_MG-2023 TaxID=3062679 RepID=UPI0026E1E7AB|nr:O-antigen ligase family protein [Marinobacter sp. 2_MG-2023]MDO6443722.1 O-antigen ligase family protein [Marinobacter sp. 2_MG-2023]